MVHGATEALTFFAGLLAKHTQKRHANQAMPVAPVTRFNKKMNQKFGSRLVAAIRAGRRYTDAERKLAKNIQNSSQPVTPAAPT
jgi:hypothetical protein